MEKDDWRLRGQESYLFGKELFYRKWTDYRSDCDHDHCEFCWDKFSASADTLSKGYTTEDNYHWICADCFESFKEKFQWTLIEK